MTREQLPARSFAEACREAARAEALIAWSGYDDTAAVFTALASIAERAERWLGSPITPDYDPFGGVKLLRELAAGFTVSNSGEAPRDV